jgi:TatD DNase family protein
MIDIHTHLYFPQYDEDREETIKRAFDAGISMMISVSTASDDHTKALQIASLDERIFASLGLHPHSFNEIAVKDDAQISVLLTDLEKMIGLHRTKVVAVGECGLDYFSRNEETLSLTDKEFQLKGFVAQVLLAKALHLPLIVHCRPLAGSMDAYEDILAIVKQYEVPTVLHCFVGDTTITAQFLELPFVYFSFTGNVTYAVKKNIEGSKDDSRKVVAMIPLESILIETDSPFLAPVPFRGKRNEPSLVRENAKKIAEIKNISLEMLERGVDKNAQRIFFAGEN